MMKLGSPPKKPNATIWLKTGFMPMMKSIALVVLVLSLQLMVRRHAMSLTKVSTRSKLYGIVVR